METQEHTQETPKQSTAQPVLLQERVGSVDAIRGFALLGILIINMALFSGPATYFYILGKGFWGDLTGFWNTAIVSFTDIFVAGKFYTMFAFLFGLGFFIFFERAKEKTNSPRILFYKRLCILLLIGLIHGFFIWSGDVLHGLALFGFLLPFFFNRKPKTILRWAFGIFIGFFLVIAMIFGLLAVAKMAEPGIMGASVQTLFADMESRIAASFQAYRYGTLAEIQAQRVSDTLFLIANNLFASVFIIFPLFLLGLYAGKKGFFQNTETNRPTLKKIWLWGLIIGLPLSVVKFISGNLAAGSPYSFFEVIRIGAGFFGDLALALFYMTSFVLLYQKRKQIFAPLGYAGRMALSNYLFQSIVCVLIFYNFGLGFYGQIGPALGLLLALAIFTVQVYLSKLWLQRYQYGPVEWLWKSLTYGKFFKMKN